MEFANRLPPDSPFGPLDPSAVVAENAHAVAFPDRFPVSEGHTLVVPRVVAASLFGLPEDVRAGVWKLVDVVRCVLMDKHRPDGFNIGLNDGMAAGQTIAHAHVHVIPRYAGDCSDPRGGVRWVFPDKARYWA